MDVPTLMHNLKEEVSCSVCMQLYTEPKQLPCLHIFCLECLNNRARTSALHGTIKCPLCQIQVVVPESGTMEALPSCFYLKNLLDILAIKECSTSKVTCENCEMKSDEASYCFHCRGFWCKACLNAHNILRANRDHRVIALKDFQNSDFEKVLKRPALCQKELHEKEVLKFYCKMCEIPVCQNCVTVEHSKHDVEYLEVTARDVKHAMTAQLKDAEKKAQTCYDCLREMEEKVHGIEERSQFVRKQIHDTVKSLIQTLQHREQELIAEVEEEAQIRQDLVAENKTKIRDNLKRIEDTVSQAKHFIDCSTAAELVKAKTFVSERSQELPVPELESTTSAGETLQTVFVENKALRQSLKSAGIGRFDKTTTQANHCTVEELNEATAGLETRFKIITRNAEKKQSYSLGDRVAVDLVSTEDGTPAGEMNIVNEKNGSYRVCCIPKRERENKIIVRVNGMEISQLPTIIQVKKRSYKLARTVGGLGEDPGKFRGPWGVAVDDNNNIIVCDWLNKRLQVFSGNGDFIKTIEHELLREPKGTCIDSAGRIYVTELDKILVFNGNGDYIRQFTTDEENQEADWYGISLDEQGNIMVCNRDLDNPAVHIFSPKAKLLKKLSRDDFDPYDCLSFEGQIFVSDYDNNAIHVFDCDGKFVKEINNYGSGNGGLVIDKTGHLLVAGEDDVQVFTVDGMFVTTFGGDELSMPLGVSVLKNGRIVVSENERNQFLIFE